MKPELNLFAYTNTHIYQNGILRFLFLLWENVGSSRRHIAAPGPGKACISWVSIMSHFPSISYRGAPSHGTVTAALPAFPARCGYPNTAMPDRVSEADQLLSGWTEQS